MTDPNETAALVNGITQGYRDHRDEELPQATTYRAVFGGNLVEQMKRYQELAEQGFSSETLTVVDRLELLALGERIANYYRHPSHLDAAVKAGATWEQIAEARGQSEDKARAEYREWAEGQHKYAGMSDAGYAAAIERADRQD